MNRKLDLNCKQHNWVDNSFIIILFMVLFLSGTMPLGIAIAKQPTQFIHSTVYGSVVDGVRMDVPSELGNQKLAELGLVDVTANPFYADSTGKQDSTVAIQSAVNFARDHQMVCFFPSGTYLISDTISCVQNYYRRANGKIFGARDFPCMLIGSRQGKRPILYLKANAKGFGNSFLPKNMVHFWARSLDDPDQPAPPISMNQMFVNIDITIGEGNSGAVAIHHRGAQGSGIQESVIDVSNGLVGVAGGCGSGGSHADITVIGGKVGLDLRETQPAPTITGITLIGQKEAAIVYEGRQALSAVGIKIVSSHQGPVITGKPVRWSPFHGQISLVDSEIIFGKDAGACIVTGSSLYLQNVYFKNTAIVAAFSDGEKLPGKIAGWFHVKEYAHGVQPNQWEGYQFAMPRYKDGIRYLTALAEVESDLAPPSDLQSRHIWTTDFPSWESPGAVNVKAAPYNAKGDGVTDDTEALRRAIDDHEIVFLPKGYYNISQTLPLNANSKIVGVGRHLSIIVARESNGSFASLDAPAPLIKTSDKGDARPTLAFFGLYSPNGAQGAYCLNWQSGEGMIRDVNFITVPDVYGFTGNPPIKLVKKNYPLVVVSGHGGGRWYNFFQEDMYAPTHGPGYRHLLISGTHRPLRFYQCNVEHSPGEANMEINDSKNITIYGLKGEEYNMKLPILMIKNSYNINVLGYGGNAAAPEGGSLFFIQNSSKFKIVHAVDTPMLIPERAKIETWHMIKEEPGQGVQQVKTLSLDRPVIYERSGLDSSLLPESEQ